MLLPPDRNSAGSSEPERIAVSPGPDDWLPLLKQALDAPPEVNEVRAEDGRIVRIDREPEPGIDLCLTEVESAGRDPLAKCILIAPIESRPEMYPDDLPFVANIPATVYSQGDAFVVSWQRQSEGSSPYPVDIEFLYEQLLQGSVEQGWIEAPTDEEPPAGAEMAFFEREGAQRTVSLAETPSMVSLFQLSDPDPEDGA